MAVAPRHWGLLLILVSLWGSSYLMVELALAAWRPLEITGLRVLTAAVVLLVAARAAGLVLPRDTRSWAWLALMAIVGNCLPYFLISWGQQEVESGLAGILAASTPLCVLVLAHLFLHDERMQPRQALAFVLGFSGIVVLMGPDSLAALGGSASRLISQLSVLGGAVCYAIATVSARFLPPMSPLTTAAGVMLLAGAVMSPFSAAALRAAGGGLPVSALWAIGFLGVLGTGLASIVYFRLIQETGARFTSLLNYLVPVWAVGLGTVALGEALPVTAWAAMGLILAGLVLMRDASPARRDGTGA